jgi:hypothetical protein
VSKCGRSLCGRSYNIYTWHTIEFGQPCPKCRCHTTLCLSQQCPVARRPMTTITTSTTCVTRAYGIFSYSSFIHNEDTFESLERASRVVVHKYHKGDARAENNRKRQGDDKERD